MKVQVLFTLILAAIVSIVAGQQYYCGRRLATALVYLCSTYEGSDDMSKRSIGHDYQDFIEEEWSSPAIPKHRALEGLRSKRQGIATECCDKPCQISELLAYC